MKKKFQVEKEEEILTYLEEKTDYSKKKLKSMVKYHQILVNGKKIKLPLSLKQGDEVSLTTEEILSLPFEIIYEDQELLVVNKKEGLLTIANGKGEENLYHQVLEYLHHKKEMVFIVNRLDKETSGIVLFTKNERLKEALQKDWNTLVVERNYVAITTGNPLLEDSIQSYLKEEKNTFVHSAKEGKLAITNYCKKKSNGPYHLLDISIQTGRKNQIRVHLKEKGIPILGDKKYGGERASRLFLHCYHLSFYHPKTKKLLSFDAKIPKEFLKWFSF